MPSEIIFTANPEASLQAFLSKRNYSSIVLLVDEHTHKYCLPALGNISKTAHLIEIKSGEEAKTLQTCMHIWSQMTSFGLDRKAIMINLGGGVIGDMGGFCASTYKRGIDFIQIPTTLLSQVDASVGGKLGIDFEHYKNHIGVFNEPQAVIISSRFLETLDARELRSGFAEVIKHALIADLDAWNTIKHKALKDQVWDEVIPHSVDIKYKITTADPLEKGLRKVLNFGHTLGHAVESYFLEKGNRILHGEAIAIGMITEAYLAMKKGFITKDALNEIERYILSIYGHVEVPQNIFHDLIELTRQDKKNEQGHVMFSLLEQLGKANYNITVGDEDMKESLTYYNSLNG